MSALPAVPEAVKEKASDILLNMVNVTIQSMSDVVEFGKQQIPEVVHQLLLWKAVESFAGFALNIIFLIIGILLATRWGKRVGDTMATRREEAARQYEEGVDWTRYIPGSNQTSTAYDFVMGGSVLVRWLLVLIGSAFIIASLQATLESLDWLKILIAPKVYLIEYAASLVKAA